MGMFDEVIINCLNCNEEIEEQTKAGECILKRYSNLDVPFEIAVDLKDTWIKCKNCQEEFQLKLRSPVTYQLIPEGVEDNITINQNL